MGRRPRASTSTRTGGIGGRKIQVDFIDSHLNPNEARNAIIKACQEDFALVGTGALLLSTVQDETGCADKTGAATGLPDIGALDTYIPQACSPVSFPFAPASIDCSTVTAHPQTYRGNEGDAKYLLKQNKDLHGSYSIAVDSPSVSLSSHVLTHTYQDAGIKSDQDWSVTGSAPQSTYTPIIQQMKSENSNYALSLQAVNGVVQERQEATLQGFTDPKVVWECTFACYYAKVFTDAGSAVDGEYIPLAFLPYDEAKANPTVKNVVKYVGKDKLTGFAELGFASGLLFQQAAKAVVAKNGANGLTRANLLTALKGITNFNAGGMIGDDEHRAEDPEQVLHARAVEGREVHPRLPEEGRHVRLQGVERGVLPAGPAQVAVREWRRAGDPGPSPRTSEPGTRSSTGSDRRARGVARRCPASRARRAGAPAGRAL